MKRRAQRNGGFIQVIIVVILALLFLRYFNISISGTFLWLKSLFMSVL